MKNIIARSLNQLLPVEQLKSVLETLIANRPLKLLRFIPQTGRSKVAWIYVENTLNKSRYSTFISFGDLQIVREKESLSPFRHGMNFDSATGRINA